MAVRIVTDSSSGLPQDILDELDITVIDLHVLSKDGKDDKDGKDSKEQVESSTSGLSTLELVAAYARQLERGGDDGVVALHLANTLSSTYSAAVAAAAVFDGAVKVVETSTVGMAVGAAAMAAATRATQGADLEECEQTAVDTLERSATWIYLPKIDGLRRSGRLSAGTAMLSAATLATKPIMRIADGKLELAGKTRTQTKAFAKLTELVVECAQDKPSFIAIQHFGAEDAANDLQELFAELLPEGTSFLVTELSEALAVHVGPGAVGVSAVFAEPVVDESSPEDA